MSQKSKNISEFEFIALMAFLMANAALAIDAILPGLGEIGESLGNTDSTDLQLIITMIFLGLGIGQLIFGTLSDSFGRKPIVYIGITLFISASAICIFASSLEMMLVGRVIQGIGLSAPRTISISIIRDSYKGDYMARITSFISVIFILIPMIAPILGQLILELYDWQSIFYFQNIFAFVTLLWFGIRQRETLIDEHRIKLTKNLFFDGAREFFKFRNSIVFTLIAGLMTGAFMVYLSASKQIFQDQYLLKEKFAYVFAGLAMMLGISTFINGSLVLKHGMKKLAVGALIIFNLNALIYVAIFFSTENPSLYILLFFLAVQFISLGFIFGNISALAMEPIGHIAGIGAALRGFISTIIAVPLAIFIGSYIQALVLPLFVGFLICGLGALLLTLYSKKD